MLYSDIKKLEFKLFAFRQFKQIAASLMVGISTLIFLESIHTLCQVLHVVSLKEFLPCLMFSMLYAVSGSLSLGVLARLAFIRHIKRVEADIVRIQALQAQVQVQVPEKQIQKRIQTRSRACSSAWYELRTMAPTAA